MKGTTVANRPVREEEGGNASSVGSVPASSTLRKALGPLISYHVLILGGAYLIVHGDLVGSRASLFAGVALVVVGIAVAIAVLYWSAGLARAKGRGPSYFGPAPISGIGRPAETRWLCLSCGWTGQVGGNVCPRCAKLTVRLLSRSPGG